MSTRRTRRPDRITVVKDLVLFSVGTLLIIWQGFVVPPQSFNLSIMIFGGTVAGVPGMVNLLATLRPEASPIDGPSSPDPAQPSPPPSSLPSSNA